MDNVNCRSVVEELRREYQELFTPLIQAYENISTYQEKERNKIFKLVKNLLNQDLNHGEIIELYNESFSLQDIGNYNGLSRERIRQIIKQYEGYYIKVGSREWTINQVDKLNQSQGEEKKLPSNKHLEKYHTQLIKALRLHFLPKQFYKKNKLKYLTQEERLEIGKNSGYDVFIGSKEWCLQELAKITGSHIDKKVFPSNEQLDYQHPDLASSIREHFTEKQEYGELSEQDRLEVVKNLGYDVTEEVKQHTTWSEERVIYEVREAAKHLGKSDLMPMQKEFTEIGRGDLKGVITRFGGQSKIAQLAGLIYQGQTVGDNGRTYWTEERVRAFLYEVAEKEGHPGCMPTQTECAKYYSKGYVIVAIFTNAGTAKKRTISWPELAKKYGLKYDLDFQPVTLAYVKSFVKSLGDSLYHLTPAEIYVLFEQQRINKTGVNTLRERSFDNLVKALQQKIRGTPPPRNRWGRKAGESIPLDAVETHIFLGYT
jgi:hypothetical protein